MSRESMEAGRDLLVDQARLESISLSSPSPIKRMAKRLVYRLFRWQARAALAEQNRVNAALKSQLDRLMLDQAETRRKLEQLANRLGHGQYESTFDYMGFENQFRGSEESIKEKQRAYLDILRDHGPVADIGCGRGEFLKLLRENQIEGVGVDMNPVAVAYCVEQGLAAVQDDARSFLSKAPDASLGGIIMNQVVEHIPFPEIVEIVSLAYLKLRDGGCFIVETINPQSLIVFTESYSLDPSHLRMIHPYTMKYLMEQMAFAEVSIQYKSPVDASMHLKPIVAVPPVLPAEPAAVPVEDAAALPAEPATAGEPDDVETASLESADAKDQAELNPPGPHAAVSLDPEAIHSYEILNGLVYGHREYAVIGYKRLEPMPAPSAGDGDGELI